MEYSVKNTSLNIGFRWIVFFISDPWIRDSAGTSALDANKPHRSDWGTDSIPVPFRIAVHSSFVSTTALQRHNGTSWVTVTGSAGQASHLITEAGRYRTFSTAGNNEFYAKATVRTITAEAGANGSVTTNPTNLTNLASGTSVTLTATPNSCYRFLNWTRKGTTTVVSTANPYTFTVTSNDSLVANFEQIFYRLDVTSAGNGTVSTTPTSTTSIACSTSGSVYRNRQFWLPVHQLDP